MKRIAIKLLLLSLSVYAGATVHAQESSFSNLDDARSTLAKVLDEFVAKDQSDALRKIPRLSTSRTDEEQRLAIQRFVQWNAQTSEKRGAATTYKLDSTSVVSDVVSRIRYIVLGERLPLTMDFYFYRAGATANWKLCDIGLSTGPLKLFSLEEKPQQPK